MVSEIFFVGFNINFKIIYLLLSYMMNFLDITFNRKNIIYVSFY